MPKRSIVNNNAIEPTAARRPYDNRVRRAQAEKTRERILAAGSDLAHRASRWDWRDLTIVAIAKEAGISERTVYRHFPTERQLHEALMRRLEQDAGVSYERLALADLPVLTSRLFASLPSFAVPVTTFVARDPTFIASDQRRREALVRAVSELTDTWTDAERRAAAAMIDALWTPLAYERLISDWKFDPAAATNAVTWALGIVIKAIREGSRPACKEEAGPA
jgi:AcrR family transcriptional regulator